MKPRIPANAPEASIHIPPYLDAKKDPHKAGQGSVMSGSWRHLLERFRGMLRTRHEKYRRFHERVSND